MLLYIRTIHYASKQVGTCALAYSPANHHTANTINTDMQKKKKNCNMQLEQDLKSE
jgi:hypothetical protein